MVLHSNAALWDKIGSSFLAQAADVPTESRYTSPLTLINMECSSIAVIVMFLLHEKIIEEDAIIVMPLETAKKLEQAEQRSAKCES
ncbi:hypothetical protein NC652_002908 [Populus alba x Populus x berolinensis]|nr:hypothetical protein NC652_002908 [Populus alba x Populus x berolinensis]